VGRAGGAGNVQRPQWDPCGKVKVQHGENRTQGPTGTGVYNAQAGMVNPATMAAA